MGGPGPEVPPLVPLLCAVAFLVALFLYLLRWWCRRHRSTSAALATGGLHADSIPVSLYHPPGDAHDDDQAAAAALCSICISALVAGDKVKVLPPCGHCFHHDCIDAWLRSHPSCPLCRCLLSSIAAKPDR